MTNTKGSGPLPSIGEIRWDVYTTHSSEWRFKLPLGVLPDERSGDGVWYEIEIPVHAEPTVHINGILYRDPKRGRMRNAWLRCTWRARHWLATRGARGAS